jgi:hypothetical protein
MSIGDYTSPTGFVVEVLGGPFLLPTTVSHCREA